MILGEAFTLFCVFKLADTSFINTSISNCFNYEALVHRNKYMPRHVYRRVNGTSVFDCAALCMSSTVCKSFSLEIKQHSCHLNSVNSTDNNTEYRPDVLFSDIQDWPKKITGACEDKACPDNTTCTVDRLHLPQCITEFPGCGTPPVFESRSPIFDGHYQGAVAVYTCPVNYISCETSCLATAQWEDVQADCVRNKWQNFAFPNMSSPLVSGPVFCRDTKTFKLTLIATPFDGRPCLNMRKGSLEDDIPFHIAFNTTPSNEFTVIDARINGNWMDYQTSTEVPVRRNEQFTLQIDYSNGVYEVYTNGQHIRSFPEKKGGLTIEWFDVEGDMQIHSVEISK